MKEIALVNSELVAIVDDEDYEKVAGKKWYVNDKRATSTYAICHIYPEGVETTQYMHVLISGFTMTDHRNNNGLDNRKENLRPTTNQLNQANRPKAVGNYSSQYKGVRFKRGKWLAGITIDRKSIHLGSFAIEEDAAKAYDVAALKAWGEHARTNF